MLNVSIYHYSNDDGKQWGANEEKFIFFISAIFFSAANILLR
jgi:hypothetical protein